MSTGGQDSAGVRSAYALALAAVCLWAVWPWRVIVNVFPWRLDATRWIGRGAYDAANWWEWVFLRKHFIGYRPVAALSYTLNPLLLGWDAWAWRLVDFSLHAGVVALVALVFRQIGGHRIASIIAALLFAAHPAVEEVLTYAARRSYTLATVFGLLALWLIGMAWTSRGRVAAGWSAGAAVAMLVGLLSNEISYVLVVVAAMLGGHAWWQRACSARGAVARLAPMAATTLVALVLRQLVLGRLGGYQIHYFAYLKNGRKAWVKLEEPEVLRVATASVDYLVHPVAMSGGVPWLPLGVLAGWLTVLGLVAVALWPARSVRAPWLALLFIAWIAVYALLYGVTGTWFWRQAYPMAIPWAMLIALAFEQVLTAGLPAWRRAAALVLCVIVVVPMMVVSPLIRGIDTRPIKSAMVGSAAIHELVPLVRGAPGPGLVGVVAELDRNGSRDAVGWVARVAKRPDLNVVLMAVGAGRTHGVLAQVTPDDQPPMLVLGLRADWYDPWSRPLNLGYDRVSLWRVADVAGADRVSVILPSLDGSFERVDLDPRATALLGDTGAAGLARPVRRRRIRMRAPPLDDDDLLDELFDGDE